MGTKLSFGSNKIKYKTVDVSHEFGHLLNKKEQLAEVTKGGGLLLLWIPAEQKKKTTKMAR